jgi:TetR/AcrR family transcriptional repressor of nem operon
MRVSREKAKENRELVIDTAAQLLRERGFDGIGVADIMKAARLTQGGFYRNFTSKAYLAPLASECAAATMKTTRLGQSLDEPFRALVEHYVSQGIATIGALGASCRLWPPTPRER